MLGLAKRKTAVSTGVSLPVVLLLLAALTAIIGWVGMSALCRTFRRQQLDSH